MIDYKKLKEKLKNQDIALGFLWGVIFSSLCNFAINWIIK